MVLARAVNVTTEILWRKKIWKVYHSMRLLKFPKQELRVSITYVLEVGKYFNICYFTSY